MFCRLEKLIKLSFFQNENEGLAYIDQLELLHSDPSRFDIASELNIKPDVTDDSVRLIEVQNWIRHLVLPNFTE